MEAFGEAIKVFAEKHLIPTILSLVIAAIIFALTPADCNLISKFTNLGYWLFVSGIIFIFIQSLIWISWALFRWFRYQLVKHSIAKSENKEKLEMLWDYVDSLSDKDRELINSFLKSNNTPKIFRDQGMHLQYQSQLLNSRSVKKQEGVDSKGPYVKYMLEESFFQDLTKSAKKYNKIGHFEEV